MTVITLDDGTTLQGESVEVGTQRWGLYPEATYYLKNADSEHAVPLSHVRSIEYKA